MKRKSAILLVAAMLVSFAVPAGAVPEEDESFGQKFKKLFVTPTPTPRPKKHSKASPSPSPKHRKTSKASPTPKPSPKPSPKPTPTPTPTPSASASPEETATPSETPTATPRSKKIRGEPVHAISPGPNQKRLKTPPEGVSIPKSSASPEEPKSEKPDRPKTSKTPPSEDSAVPESSKANGKTSSIASDKIARYDDNDASVRKVLAQALLLTTRNLDYKYGSADPASGGMDCSGFVYYVLKQSGLKDVPRDAREQYIWLRKAGTFQAVLGHSEDTFELEELKPGDLLFWAGTYRTEKDPAITHTMIYLGREKGSNQRIMVGSSDGRTYKGQSRYGVSVFDFHVATHKRAANPDSDEQALTPTFVGYGHIPDLEAVR